MSIEVGTIWRNLDKDKLTVTDVSEDEVKYIFFDGSFEFSDTHEEFLGYFEQVVNKASDTQIGGTHYTEMGIQPLEFTYLNYGYMGLKASVHTKVNKYFRCKTNEVEDLKKARHCIDILIEKAILEANK